MASAYSAIAGEVELVLAPQQPHLRPVPQRAQRRLRERLQVHGTLEARKRGVHQRLQCEPARGVLLRPLGLHVDALAQPRRQGDHLVERRDLEPPVERGAAERRQPLARPQRLHLVQREVPHLAPAVRGVGEADVVPAHEHAVARADDVGLEEVRPHRGGERVGLQRVLGAVPAGAPMPDDDQDEGRAASMAPTTSGILRRHLRRPALDQLAVGVDEVLGEVPDGRRAVGLAGEVLPQRIRIGAHGHLRGHRERHAVVALAELADRLGVVELLAGEVRGRAAEDLQALVGVLLVELLQPLELRREAALGRRVDDQRRPAAQRLQVQLAPLEQLDLVRVEVRRRVELLRPLCVHLHRREHAHAHTVRSRARIGCGRRDLNPHVLAHTRT